MFLKNKRKYFLDKIPLIRLAFQCETGKKKHITTYEHVKLKKKLVKTIVCLKVSVQLSSSDPTFI